MKVPSSRIRLNKKELKAINSALTAVISGYPFVFYDTEDISGFPDDLRNAMIKLKFAAKRCK